MRALFLGFCVVLASVWTAPSRAASPVLGPDDSLGPCTATFREADGRKLVLARQPDGALSLKLSIPGGGFVSGGRYDLDLTLDTSPRRKVRALALGAEALLLPLGGNADFIEAFAAAHRLDVAAGRTTLSFALAEMGTTMDSLKACGGKRSAPLQEAPSSRAEKPTANLKSGSLPSPFELARASGLKDITPMKVEDRPVDVMWRVGKITGGAREYDAGKDKKLSELVGLHVRGLEKNCAGSFRAVIGREERRAGLTLRVANIECHAKEAKTDTEPKEKSVYEALLYYLTESGSFTVLTHEGALEDKAAVNIAREAVRKALLTAHISGQD
ncbi:MAG: hypothetical protein HGA90_00185 [Alphaproteobacteria bacterium]|nr:hypothetical protein [Alphaproteobacteria bacterium]